MINVDSQEWWMWQMYRRAAEFIREPSNEHEARLQFFVTSYRYFHLTQNETTTANQLNHSLQSCLG